MPLDLRYDTVPQTKTIPDATTTSPGVMTPAQVTQLNSMSSAVTTNATLTGNGSAGSPLGINLAAPQSFFGGVLTVESVNGIFLNPANAPLASAGSQGIGILGLSQTGGNSLSGLGGAGGVISLTAGTGGLSLDGVTAGGQGGFFQLDAGAGAANSGGGAGPGGEMYIGIENASAVLIGNNTSKLGFCAAAGDGGRTIASAATITTLAELKTYLISLGLLVA